MCGMSSFNELILKPVKRRLGFVLVMAIAGLVTALVTGSSLAAAVVVIGVIVFLGAILDGRRSKGPEAGSSAKRAPGEPYSASYRWRTHEKPSLAELYRGLARQGLVQSVETQTPTEVVLKGGSQFWTRLLGGYFVNPKRLPIRVSLKTPDAVIDQKFIVELGVRDRFGVGVRDEALEERFALAAAAIRTAVETRLDAIGGYEADSGLGSSS